MKKQIYLLLLLITHIYFLQAQNIKKNNTDSLYKKNLLQNNPFNLKEKKWSVEVDFNKIPTKLIFPILKPTFIELGITQINPNRNSENKITFYTVSTFGTSTYYQNPFNLSEIPLVKNHNLYVIYTGLENRKYIKKSNFYYSKILGLQVTNFDEYFVKGENNKNEHPNYYHIKNEFNILLGGGIGYKTSILKSNFTWGAEIKLGYFLLPMSSIDSLPLVGNYFHLAPLYVDIEYLRIGYIFK